MVYGRTLGERTIELEASGGLMSASLVMRDRQTDSWWSIMTADAIAGPLEGTSLRKLPVGEKSTWGDWRARHPDSKVLSVNGVEHVDNNPYDNYFATDRTFREMAVEDERLAAKAPIYSFWLDDEPWAAAHEAYAGGALFDVGLSGRRLLLFRPQGSPIYTSSRAWLVDDEVAASAPTFGALADRLASGAADGEAIGGFDTFWYTWVAVNPRTRLLTEGSQGAAIER